MKQTKGMLFLFGAFTLAGTSVVAAYFDRKMELHTSVCFLSDLFIALFLNARLNQWLGGFLIVCGMALIGVSERSAGINLKKELVSKNV